MARLDQENRDEAYRVFVTESLKLIPQNKYLTARYDDVLKQKVENKTGEEIAIDVIKRAGLVFKE